MWGLWPHSFEDGRNVSGVEQHQSEDKAMSGRKLVHYRRCSTARQGVSALGLDAQTEAVESYAKTIGGAIVKTFTEVESGTHDDRPELAKALAFAKRAGCCLCVARLDRLARSVHFVSGLLEAGVDFIAVDMPEANRTMLQMMAVIAEYESRACRSRTRQALAQAKARGTLLGSARPGAPQLSDEAASKGRKLGERKRQENAVKAYADLAPMMAEMRDAGGSLRDVAKALNNEGHCTRRGKPFTAMQVSRVLGRISA